MIINLTVILYLFTFVVTFISNYYAKKNKRLYDLRSITNIVQVDALFDILVGATTYNENVRWVYLVYTLGFPLYIIFLSKNTIKRGLITMAIIVSVSMILFCFLNYHDLIPYINYYIYPALFIQIAAISVCTYRSVHIERIIKAKNYFYYLLLGFLILDFFYFLVYYKVLNEKIEAFIQFAYYSSYYLNFIRIVYLLFVINLFIHAYKSDKSRTFIT